MTANIDKLFPVHDVYYLQWKDKTIEELTAIQDNLLRKMDRMDSRASMGIYQKFENTLAQLDIMIERKHKESEIKEKEQSNKPYNERPTN